MLNGIDWPDDIILHRGTELLPQCGVLALMFTCRVKYTVMRDWIRDSLNKRSHWKGRMVHKELEQTLDFFGISWDRYKNLNIKLKHVCALAGNKRMIIHVRGHYLYYENGALIDQYCNASWTFRTDKGLNKRVKNIWHIKSTL